MGATGRWNIDMGRAARETLENYAALSYYEIWLGGLEKLLLASGAVSADELRQGRMLQAPAAMPRVLHAASVAAVLARGSPVMRTPSGPQRFAVGQSVRTRAQQADHHTRLPGYARGKRGIIERVHGVHVFADTQAQALGEQPHWLYTVLFNATELWGESTASDALDTVSVDAWEPYLEPA
jgi:nitrile hydratase